jgi:hypothetical protein
MVKRKLPNMGSGELMRETVYWPLFGPKTGARHFTGD